MLLAFIVHLFTTFETFGTFDGWDAFLSGVLVGGLGLALYFKGSEWGRLLKGVIHPPLLVQVAESLGGPPEQRAEWTRNAFQVFLRLGTPAQDACPPVAAQVCPEAAANPA